MNGPSAHTCSVLSPLWGHAGWLADLSRGLRHLAIDCGAFGAERLTSVPFPSVAYIRKPMDARRMFRQKCVDT